MHLVIEMGDIMWLFGGLAVLYFLFRAFVNACVDHPEMVLPMVRDIYRVVKNGAKGNQFAEFFANRDADQAFANDFKVHRARWNPDAYKNEPNDEGIGRYGRCVPVLGAGGQIFCGPMEAADKPVDVEKTKVLLDEKENDDVKAGVEA